MNPPGVLRAWLWTGTEFEPAEAIPVGDRGFRYGMSVFESFPLHSGFAPFLEAHLARLRHACDVTGFSVPVEALDACEPILRQGPDGFARIYITAGDGPVTAPYDRPRVLILVEPRQRPTAKTYHRGYDLALHAGNHVPLFPGLKTGN